MDLATQRRIDRYVGIPVCLVLGVLRGLYEWLVSGSRRSRESFLFIELSEMGSTILASAAIRRLQKRYPEAEYSFVIFERNAASLHLLGLFPKGNVFTIRDESIATIAVDIARFIKFCIEKRVDTAIDLELFSRVSSLLSLLSGARERVGFHNYRGEGLYRGEHLSHRVHYNPYLHMSQNFLALVEALDERPDGIPLPKQAIGVPPVPMTLPIEQDAFSYVQSEVERCLGGSPDGRVVVLNHDAGSLLPLRAWPVPRFAELARRLIDYDPTLVVLLMGIPEGKASAQRIVDTVADARCIDFVGQTRSLVDVIQLFHQTDLLITNDSGPAHFASLTPIPSITLFGPETPVLYGPLGPRAVHLYAGLACSPCLSALNHRNSPCTDNVCLQAIEVDEVFEHARRLLEAAPPRPRP